MSGNKEAIENINYQMRVLRQKIDSSQGREKELIFEQLDTYKEMREILLEGEG